MQKHCQIKKGVAKLSTYLVVNAWEEIDDKVSECG